MKPLLLSTFDIEGGAARAAYRLHQGLQSRAIASQMLVQDKFSHDSTVIAPRPNFRRDFARARPSFDDLLLKFYPHRQKSPFSCQWLPDRLVTKVNQLAPDVINLHWINGGYVQIETLAKLKPPLVMTLHDMWAFTGGCHYSQDCDRYTEACGACPQLGSSQSWDLSRWIWQRKLDAWKRMNAVVVTPSRWLAGCAQRSALFREARVEVIPNGLDTRLFRPIDRQTARSVLQLPQDKKLILSGAVNLRDDRRKGLSLLQAALHHLSQSEWKDRLELVLYGASAPQSTEAALDFNVPVHYLGTLKDDLSLVLAYSAADVFVAPSTQENLPNTVMEALACSLPSVAFHIGGMPDLISHQLTGYLAQPFEPADFAQGIAWVIEDPQRQQELAVAARRCAEKEFRFELQAERYIHLFKSLL